MSAPSNALVVVGSLNLDLSAVASRLPGPGETVIGGDLMTAPGGKGANQAVAVARLGARVAMIGRTGNDDAGRQLRGTLVGAGVNTSGVTVDPSAPTGAALIFVDEFGENSIVVAPGANSRVSGADIDAVAWMLEKAPVVLFQLEIPIATVAHGMRRTAGIVILNPAPAHHEAIELLTDVDILVPNRGELAMLTDRPMAANLDEVSLQARMLRGPEAVVVTLGSDGALVVEGESIVHIPAEPVEVVDTTGAGDAFTGALAVAVADGRSVEEATRYACRAAAFAVGRRGAQAALATLDDLR